MRHRGCTDHRHEQIQTWNQSNSGEDSADAVSGALREAALDADVLPVEANLEDVFVAATRGRADEEGAPA